MFGKFMRLVTIFVGVLVALNPASAERISINAPKGGKIKGGCDNEFEFINNNILNIPKEIPQEIGQGKPNCLFGDGTIRSICTSEILAHINLEENNMRIKADDSIKEDGMYNIPKDQTFPMLKKFCHKEIKIKKDIPIELKKGQKAMMFANGDLIDRISGKEIKHLKEGVDYEVTSDEEMAKAYQHNRGDEERNVQPQYFRAL